MRDLISDFINSKITLVLLPTSEMKLPQWILFPVRRVTLHPEFVIVNERGQSELVFTSDGRNNSFKSTGHNLHTEPRTKTSVSVAKCWMSTKEMRTAPFVHEVLVRVDH